VVEVLAKLGKVDAGCTPEHGEGGFRPYESVSTQRGQLSDGYAVSGDDKALALV
jgi:hypothetical protein